MLWLIVILTLLDSVIGAFLYQQGLSRQAAIAIVYVKYVIFAFAFLNYIIWLSRRPLLYGFEIAGVSYMLLTLALSLAIGQAYPDSEAVSRLYIYYFPIVIYFAGSYFGTRDTLSLKMVVSAYALCYLVVNGLFGVQYYVIGGEILWKDVLGYANFVAEVKGFSDGVINGLPGNFYYDPYNLQVPRFVGSMGDPLAVAYSGMPLLIALLWVRPRRWKVFAPLIATMVVLTLTRGVILGCIVGLALFFTLRRYAFGMTLMVGATVIIAVLVFGEAIFETLGDSSTAGHIDSISELGLFLTPGALAVGALGSGDVPFFEPGLFNILFSFGIIPFVLFLWFLGGIYRSTLWQVKDSGFLSVSLLIGLVTLTIMSSSFLAVTSSWFAWFCFGFNVSRHKLLFGGNALSLAKTDAIVSNPRTSFVKPE